MAGDFETEKLLAELRAIEYWDAEYLSQTERDNLAVQAYEARQRRRAVILKRLSKLLKKPLADTPLT